MRVHRRLWPWIAIVLVGVSGCASGTSPSTDTPATVSFAQGAPEPVARCGYPDGARKVVVTTADGVTLAAAEVGSGPRGVVLLHQRTADLCGWSGFVPALAKAGLHVLAIDFRCNGMSDCDRDAPGDTFDQSYDYAADAAAAVAHLRTAGATKVAVVGASMGAVTAVVAGGRFPDQVDAVVGLSVFSATWSASGGSGSDIRTATDAVPRTRAPILIAVGGLDTGGTITAKGARALLSGAPAAARCVVVDRPESLAHGWSLLDDGDDSVAPDVLAFLATNLAA
jgi:pimeloyl-ACP methyl ester carboxylesterase